MCEREASSRGEAAADLKAELKILSTAAKHASICVFTAGKTTAGAAQNEPCPGTASAAPILGKGGRCRQWAQDKMQCTYSNCIITRN